jgi:uncharacterized membrane protein
MSHGETHGESLIISYLTLRRLVGLLGIALPFVLVVGGALIFGVGQQSSISSYYYTPMRNVFVGTLCVIGFFLLSYRGYEPRDNIAGNLACLFAVGVAFFPTAPDGDVPRPAAITGHVHLAFAAAFFATLIYFSLCLFTKTTPGVPPTPRKLQRNTVYRICGYVMAVCMLLILAISLIPGAKQALQAYAPVFWLEGLAVIAFGASWLTKGEAILADKVQRNFD